MFIFGSSFYLSNDPLHRDRFVGPQFLDPSDTTFSSSHVCHHALYVCALTLYKTRHHSRSLKSDVIMHSIRSFQTASVEQIILAVAAGVDVSRTWVSGRFTAVTLRPYIVAHPLCSMRWPSL